MGWHNNGNPHSNEYDIRSGGGRLRTDSGFSIDSHNGESSNNMVGNRGSSNCVSNNVRDLSQEGINMTDSEFVKAKIVIGIIGYGIAAFMFLKALGVI